MRRTAEKKARKKLEYEMYGTPRERAKHARYLRKKAPLGESAARFEADVRRAFGSSR